MGMRNITSLNRASETTLQTTRELIHDELFCQRHRRSDRDFTRRRKLPFANVMVMLLQKTVRSIQLHLHAFFAALPVAGQSASASSWCEARLKLKHTAFIELNERAILDVVYGGKHDFAVRLWRGHRLLGSACPMNWPWEKSLAGWNAPTRKVPRAGIRKRVCPP